MKKNELFKHNGKEPETHSNFFEEELKRMFQMAGALDELYWDIEKEGINTHVIRSINESVNEYYEQLSWIFRNEEEILFPEIEKLIPSPEIVKLLRDENAHIIAVLESIKSMFNGSDEIRKEKDMLQAEMISLADLLKRNSHKKYELLLTEVNNKLPQEKINEMTIKLKESFFVQA
ncbi:MAG: hypothetical protein JNK43_09550 [Ignavibacteria bacterium]|nr:hypothetical protein [Ignavibacteria bacterium]